MFRAYPQELPPAPITAIFINLPTMASYIKSIHPTVLDKWKAEVDALPNRKKSKWSTMVKNTTGTFHKYRYNAGYFEVKYDAAMARHSGVSMMHPTGGWAPVIPLRGAATFEQIERAYGPDNARNVTEDNFDNIYLSRVTQADEEAVTMQALVEQENAATMAIAANHTGNHHRNHAIAVPVAVGQPVRG